MKTKYNKILPKTSELLELVDEDGMHAIIRKDSITGVFGNKKSSTICFGGHSIAVKYPIRKTLTLVGFGKNTEECER